MEQQVKMECETCSLKKEISRSKNIIFILSIISAFFLGMSVMFAFLMFLVSYRTYKIESLKPVVPNNKQYIVPS